MDRGIRNRIGRNGMSGIRRVIRGIQGIDGSNARFKTLIELASDTCWTRGIYNLHVECYCYC